MSAKNQVMFVVQRVFGSPNVIQRSVRSKITKADLMKKLQRDNKVLFGSLVETKKQKMAREKREKKIRIPKKSTIESRENKSNEIDTEAYYMMNSKSQALYNLDFSAGFEPHQTKTILRIDDSKKSIEEKAAIDKTPCANSSKEIFNHEENSEPEITRDKKTEVLGLPSRILINKMTSFFYINENKCEVENIGEKRLVSISPSSDKSKLTIPSVTKILNKTMSPESRLNLELWKQRMIRELGQDGFEEYSKELLLNGKQFHSSIQNFLTRKPYDVPSSVEKSWQSVQHVLKDVNDVRAIESHAVNSQLHYRGIIDCVAMYKGKLCVIDWKKSDKPKNSIEHTYDAPVQVASYIGALNSDSNYNFQVRNGLVVVGYTNGDPATVHELNPMLVNKYWIIWLRRLQQYYLDLTSVKQDSSMSDASEK